jgi:hypothetical protein
MNDIKVGLLIGFALGICATMAWYTFVARLRKRRDCLETGQPSVRPAPPSGSEFARLLGGSPPGTTPKGQNTTVVAGLRQNLRLKFMHDEAKIDRAVSYERERNPGGTEEELMRAAIYRWERDNK